MADRVLKKLLQETLHLENELYDFCIECLEKMYGEDANYAVGQFKESYNLYDHNGCINSLFYIDSQVKLNIERRKEREQKRSENQTE